MKKRKRNIVQADTPDGQLAGEALVQVVENQIQDNDPPETRITLDRLMSLGESRENAMRYIASAWEAIDEWGMWVVVFIRRYLQKPTVKI